LPDVIETFPPICTWETGNNCKSLDPAARFLALPSDLFIKATWYSFPTLSTLPLHPGSHCHLGGWNRQTYCSTRTHRLGSSVVTLMEYKGSYGWQTSEWPCM
jgi:hypothetical protein